MKRFFLPIFWKFTIAIIAIVSIFGSISVALMWHHVIRALQSESEKKGLYVAKNLATQATDPILYEDHINLQKLVDGVKDIDASIIYAFIMGENNKVFVHTFPVGVPVELLKANTIPENASINIKEYQLNNLRI